MLLTWFLQITKFKRDAPVFIMERLGLFGVCVVFNRVLAIIMGEM